MFGRWTYVEQFNIIDQPLITGMSGKIRCFQGFKRGNLTTFLTEVFTLNSDPIRQTLGVSLQSSQFHVFPSPNGYVNVYSGRIFEAALRVRFRSSIRQNHLLTGRGKP